MCRPFFIFTDFCSARPFLGVAGRSDQGFSCCFQGIIANMGTNHDNTKGGKREKVRDFGTGLEVLFDFVLSLFRVFAVKNTNLT